jgi:hypothetical protein
MDNVAFVLSMCVTARAKVSQIPGSKDAHFVEVANHVGLIENDGQDMVCAEEKGKTVENKTPGSILSSDYKVNWSSLRAA